MSLEHLAEKVGETSSRSGFLRRAGTATLGAAAVFLGVRVSDAGATVPYLCCNLCQSPSDTCTPTCSWCWWGCWAQNNRKYNCCEGYSAGGTSCTGSCNQWLVCSYVQDLGPNCVHRPE